VSFDRPVDVLSMPDPSQPPEAYDALVGGLHAAPAMIRHDGNQHGIQLSLTPLGARGLFGMPASELAAKVVHLDQLRGRWAGELVERLAEAPGWPDRFAVLDDVLGSMAAPAGLPERAPAVAHAWEAVVEGGGTLDVRSLADEVGWSRRHLTEQFRSEFGLGPKVLSRVARFQQARKLLQRGPASLADVAVACGYTDQAHMTKEWRRLAGAPPRAWLEAENLPFVQDDGPLVGAS
jgi:AraC-like DNA-binding protein